MAPKQPVVVLVGASGCGKTALYHMLTNRTFALETTTSNNYVPTVETLTVRCHIVRVHPDDLTFTRSVQYPLKHDSRIAARRAVRFNMTIDPRFVSAIRRWRSNGRSRDDDDGGIECLIDYRMIDTSGEIFNDMTVTTRPSSWSGGGSAAAAATAVNIIARRRERARRKYFDLADILAVVYNPYDERSVDTARAILINDSLSRRKDRYGVGNGNGGENISSTLRLRRRGPRDEQIILVMENNHRRCTTTNTNGDVAAAAAEYYRSLRHYSNYRNSNLHTDITSNRYFFACDDENGVREAFDAAFRHFVIQQYKITAWRSSQITRAIHGLSVATTATTNEPPPIADAAAPPQAIPTPSPLSSPVQMRREFRWYHPIWYTCRRVIEGIRNKRRGIYRVFHDNGDGGGDGGGGGGDGIES